MNLYIKSKTSILKVYIAILVCIISSVLLGLLLTCTAYADDNLNIVTDSITKSDNNSFPDKIQYDKNGNSGILSKNGTPVATIVSGSSDGGDSKSINVDILTGATVPPSTWQYNEGGYTGVLTLVNYENNPYPEDLGHHDTVERFFSETRYNTCHNFYNADGTLNKERSYSTWDNSSSHLFIEINEDGFVGTLPRNTAKDTQSLEDRNYFSDGSWESIITYTAVFEGTLTKNGAWIPNEQMVDHYTGHYTGTVTSAINDTRVWQYTQNYRGAVYSQKTTGLQTSKPVNGECSTDPVNVVTGNFYSLYGDLKIDDRGLPLEITRYYNSLDKSNGILGKSWKLSYDSSLEIDSSSGEIKVCYPDGHTVFFKPISGSNEYSPYGPIFDKLYKNADNTFTLKLQNTLVYKYNSNGKIAAITDKNGNTLTFEYNASGSLFTVTSASGKTLSFSYENGRIKTVTDSSGRTITYNYDSNGYLTEVYGLGNGVMKYEYTPDGSLKSITDANNKKFVDNEYDEFGRVVNQYDENRNITEFTYDEANMQNTVKMDSVGSIITYQYNESLYIIKKTFEDNTYEEYTYDQYGNRDSVKDRNGNVTKYTFDSHGNMLTETSPEPFKYVTNYTYDSKDNLNSVTTPEGSQINFEYDSDSNLKKVTKKVDDTTSSSTSYTYDEHGRVKTITNPENGVISYEYNDSGNNPVKITDPENNVLQYTYDNLNRVSTITTSYGTTTYEYNTDDKVVKITDPAGNISRMKYDNNGNLIKLIKPQQYDSTSDDGNGYAYKYNGINKIVEQIDPLNSISVIKYNQLGNITKEVNPNYYSASTNDGAGAEYQYDGGGRLTKVVDSEGNKSRIKYDGSGNKAKIIDANNYNESSDDGPGIESTYDEMNRVVLQKDTFGNVVKCFVYDKDSRLIKEIDAKGYLYGTDNDTRYGTIYKYNKAGWLTEIRKPMKIENSTVYYQIKRYEYDLNGRITQEKFSAEYVTESGEPSNWNVTSYTYYKTGKLKTVSDSLGGYAEYTYDSLGNITGYKQKIKDNKYQVIGYHYNNAGMMDKSWQEIDAEDLKDGGTGKVLAETLYEYDKNGNVTKVTTPEGYVTTYEYDDAGRMKVKNEEVSLEDLNIKKTGISITSTKAVAYPGQQFECNVGIQPDSSVTGVNIEIDYDSRVYQFLGFNPSMGNVFIDGGTDGKIFIKASNTSYSQNTILANIKFKVKEGIQGIGYIAINPSSSYTDNQGKECKYFQGNGKAISVGIPDMNNDLKVGVDDFTLDALQKGVFAGSQEYNEKFDINGDGVIDVTDLDYIKDYLFGNVQLNSLIPGKFLSNYTSYSYDVSATKALRTTKYEYDKAGNLIKETDCNNNFVVYEYNASNRLISVTDKSGAKFRVFYDKMGNVIKEVSPENYNQASDNGPGTTYTYDSMNRLILTSDASGNVVQKNVYDINGNIAKTIGAKGYISGSDDKSRYGTDYNFDIGNRVISIYTPESSLKGKASAIYTYDAIGNVLTYTDGEENTTIYENDMRGNILRVTDPYNVATVYTYDNAGNLTSVTDGKSNTTNYSYNSLNKLSSMTDPMGQVTTYKYDRQSRVRQEVDRNGQIINFDYNSDNNLTSRSIEGKYETEKYIYGLNGLLKTAVNSSYMTEYNYNPNGQITQKTINGSVALNYDYNKNGAVSKLTDKTGSSVSYTYDIDDRLKTVTNGTNQLAVYNYNPDSTLSGIAYNNGVSVTYGYDRDNQVTSLKNVGPQGKAITDFTYTYDNNGNELSKTENGVKTSYTYDKLNRLLTADNESYTYDNAGNRLTKTVGSIVTTYDYDANNRLIKSKNNGITTTYNYDNNGNQLNQSTNGQTTSYTYDGYNRLILVDNPDSTWQMNIYDAEGLRASTVENGARTDYVFDRGSVISETAVNNNSTTRYIRGIGLVAQDNNGTLGYYLHNAHGDVVNIVDNTGNVLNTYSYDPFGGIASTTGNTANRFMYAGEQYDSVAGQYYLRTRQYNPNIGRFTAADIYAGTPNNPISQNRYTYCENNPIMYTDPLGLWKYLGVVGGVDQYKVDDKYDTLSKLAREVFNDSSKYTLFPDYNRTLHMGDIINVTSGMKADAGLLKTTNTTCSQGKAGNSQETCITQFGNFRINGNSPEYPDYVKKAISTSYEEHGSLEYFNSNTETFRGINNIYDAAYSQAFALAGGESGQMLLHYLDNVGGYYNIDFSKMNRESKSASAKRTRDINNAIAAAEALCCNENQTIYAASINEDQDGSIGVKDSLNWFVAIHNYRTYTRFSVVKNGNMYTMKMEYHLRDFYDWDKNDSRKVGLVSASNMWALNAYGLAKTYQVTGEEDITVTWTKGQLFGTGASVK